MKFQVGPIKVNKNDRVVAMRNAATGAIMWLAALLRAVIAVSWPSHLHSGTGFVVFVVLYSAAYARLMQFC